MDHKTVQLYYIIQFLLAHHIDRRLKRRWRRKFVQKLLVNSYQLFLSEGIRNTQGHGQLVDNCARARLCFLIVSPSVNYLAT